ncbi:MAG: M23 family metallopeptidase [Bacteroidota bacterium]|nr:M23 family metallopeptidase [Bacteroidota bacterium]
MKKPFLIFLFLSTIVKFSIAQTYHPPLDFRLLLSGTFGELRSSHFHTGIDIKTQGVVGQKVYTIDDGYISRIKISSFGYGKALYITHPNGLTSVYAHLKKFNEEIEEYVRKYQYKKESFEIELFPKKDSISIKKGDFIALSGNSGGSFGAHLHFEIRETKSQKPVNPLRFDFEIKDEVKPIIKEIKIYDFENTETNIYKCIKEDTNYTIKEQPEVGNEIGFGILTYDRSNDAYNKNGVYSIELFVNKKSIYNFVADKLDFATNRYINSHIDYYEKKENNKKFHRCYKLPNNLLTNYRKLNNNGIIELTNDSVYNILLVIKDFYANTSYLKFDIKSSQKQKKEKEKLTGEIFTYNQNNQYKNPGFKLNISKNSLYDNINFQYACKDSIKGVYGYIHQCHFDNEPVHKKYSLDIATSVPERLKKQTYIAKRDKDGNYWYIGGIWKGEVLSTQVREFGDFCIIADTISPTIKGVNIFPGKIITTQKTIKCTIEDKESGIQSYRGEIDGKWILMEYDYKRKLLVYELDESIDQDKYHEFVLKVVDRVSNTKTYKATFKF